MTHPGHHGGEGHEHHHHEIPTEGRALTSVAVSATLHCLTGCAIGEVTGMAIGTALGFSGPRNHRARGRARLSVRLHADQPAAAPRWARPRRGDSDRVGFRHPLHRGDGDRGQPDHGAHPRRHGCRPLGHSLLGGTFVRSLPCVPGGAAGEPLADLERQGPCRGPRDRNPRRSLAARRRRGARGGGSLRRRCPDRGGALGRRERRWP